MGLALLQRNERSKATLETGLTLARGIGDTRGELLVLRTLAEFHWQSNDVALARHFARRSLGVAEESGDKWYRARALYWLVRSRRRIDRKLLSRTLALYKKSGAAEHQEARAVAEELCRFEGDRRVRRAPHNTSVE